MPLSSTLARFATCIADGSPAGYVVTRYVAATYASNGVATAGTNITFTLNPADCVVQAISGRRLIVIPDGVRTEDVRMLQTTTALQANPPDRITIGTDQYEVYASDGPYFISGGVYYSALIARTRVPG